MGEALDDAGLSKLAKRWLSCSEKAFTRVKPKPGAALPKTAEIVYVCRENHHHDAEIYSQTCDLRICPECARRHAARLVARYLPKMQELMHNHRKELRFRHITFTTPYSLRDENIKKKLLKGFKQVERVMQRMMLKKDPDWKTNQGYLVTSEFGATGLKLHYHVIHYGRFLDQADMVTAWRQATKGDAYIVDVRGFPYRGMSIEETLREVLKYAVKFYSQDPATGEIKATPAELMPILARTLEKTRRIRSYGVFYNLPESEKSPHVCEACGSPMLGIPVDYFVTFCNTGFLPLEWKRQTDGDALQFKPADKSLNSTTGIAPPGDPPERLTQKQLAILKDLRIQSHD